MGTSAAVEGMRCAVRRRSLSRAVGGVSGTHPPVPPRLESRNCPHSDPPGRRGLPGLGVRRRTPIRRDPRRAADAARAVEATLDLVPGMCRARRSAQRLIARGHHARHCIARTGSAVDSACADPDPADRATDAGARTRVPQPDRTEAGVRGRGRPAAANRGEARGRRDAERGASGLSVLRSIRGVAGYPDRRAESGDRVRHDGSRRARARRAP